ncbi:hypothetical protein LWI28_003215 [Acer negundo]|uniref:Uncharacterized protein n=1 Tax=Acer negundo TaxID=4023 RepID=A0AAD5NZ82_ACENE|nr:hypothetical protein LWI28_003215 [Acer negundo]
MNDSNDSSSTNPTYGTQGSNNPLSARGPNDSFFVQHSENPSAVLVSPKLSGDNCNTGSLTGIAPQANMTAASLDNEKSPDAPPVSDSSPVSTSAQPIPPIRSVRSRQPPSYLKHYHCPTLPHVANLVQSDSKRGLCLDMSAAVLHSTSACAKCPSSAGLGSIPIPFLDVPIVQQVCSLLPLEASPSPSAIVSSGGPIMKSLSSFLSRKVSPSPLLLFLWVVLLWNLCLRVIQVSLWSRLFKSMRVALLGSCNRTHL